MTAEVILNNEAEVEVDTEILLADSSKFTCCPVSEYIQEGSEGKTAHAREAP